MFVLSQFGHQEGLVYRMMADEFWELSHRDGRRVRHVNEP